MKELQKQQRMLYNFSDMDFSYAEVEIKNIRKCV